MRMLIAGGAGFLGSHLCGQLLKLDYEVVCLDDLSTGTHKNIEKFLENKKFSFEYHDVTKPIKLEHFDGILNFACPASPLAYQQNPIQTLKTSILGSMNLLDLANRYGARILQASTSEIYGDPAVSPQTETYWGNVNPVGIRACYDEGKRAAETLFMDSSRQANSDVRIARIFNTYGSNMAVDDGRVVSNFIVQALSNKPLTIYGNGHQSRSFCYVDDLIDGILKLFHYDLFLGPINLGNPSTVTILDLAHEIIELTNSDSKIIFYDLPSDDPKHRKPDITMATRTLGWMPRVSRKEGLAKTINYFKNAI
jgi:UDP-glucuronate decarboxylase